MVKSRPRFPWKVIFLTPEGPLPEERFTSESKAYLAVNLKRELVREESSAVTRALVYEWNRSYDRWDTFEKHDLKAEADASPPNPWLSAPPGIPDEVELFDDAEALDDAEAQVPVKPVKRGGRPRGKS